MLVLAMGASLAAGAHQVPVVYARTDAEIKRDEYKDKLKDTKKDIQDIESNQASVSQDLKSAANQMKTLLNKQETLKGDISKKQAEVEQANEELKEAKRVEKEQYEAMKLRIQYMYENSTDNSIWTAVIESDGLADMLNRIEYATDLYQSDRDLMDSYEEAVQKVEDWTMQLADDMEKLLALKDEYEKQQDDLDILIAQLEQKKDDYAQQLADADGIRHFDLQTAEYCCPAFP